MLKSFIMMAIKQTRRQHNDIMLQAFDESSSFLGAIKALESFEGLLDRPALAIVVRKCGAMLMSDLTLDLRRVCFCPLATPGMGSPKAH